MQVKLLKPAEYAEKSLIESILNGITPPGSTLPAERDLALRLGVARPALREALQRLARDGWIVIQHGKATRVSDYWCEGGLNVLSALVRHADELPADFIPNLLEVRLALAPAYTRLAVQRSALQIATLLQGAPAAASSPEEFAAFDWRLHHALTVASGNPIYTLILNGFAGFYEQMAVHYFNSLVSRQASEGFYIRLRQAAQLGDPLAAQQAARQAMLQALELWAKLS
jgi:GntR family negative regulator for fad regulon and positive regulator of fabA